jgi:hypothetical protein
VLEALKGVRPYYWDEMPGPTDGERIDQAEAQKISYQEFRQLLKGPDLRVWEPPGQAQDA